MPSGKLVRGQERMGGDERFSSCKWMAGIAGVGLGTDPRDASHVDTDRRKDPPVARPIDQPLVAGHAVREPARLDHVLDPGPAIECSTWSLTSSTTCLRIRTSDGEARTVALAPKSVAEFYAETLTRLGQLGIEPRITARPNEVEPAIPFADDHEHAAYNPAAAHLFWRQLVRRIG